MEHDRSYLTRIVAAFGRKYADKFEIYSFTSPEVALETLNSARIEVLLSSDVFEIDVTRLPNRCAFGYLVESADVEMIRNQRAICKFQKADEIYKQILSIYAEKASTITGFKVGGDECAVITFCSASGGVGSSTMAAACAAHFAAKGSKVLYLNLEKFGSADLFFSGKGNFDMSDIIFALKKQNVNLPMKLESCVRQDANGVYFYAGTKLALDMMELNMAEILRLINELKISGGYDSCFNIIETVRKRALASDKIDAIEAELAYAYDLERCGAVKVENFSSNFCAVQYKNGEWSYLTSLGGGYTAGSYQKAGAFTSSGLAPVQLLDGGFALIDISGRLKSRSPEGLEVEDCTPLLSGMMAVKYNGKYRYCNSLFEELFGAYDYAGSFYGGVAAVMEGDKWAIIGENGDQITDFVFEEIKLDDKGIAFRNGRAFAKINGSYMLIDANGKQVGKAVWDDVDAFNSDMIAAVMKDGKWGFVDGDGKVVVEYQYEMAQSFANGMAAVMVGEKWGYISAEDFEMKIQPAFHAARDFSSNGTAFVIDGERWRMLRIYRLT